MSVLVCLHGRISGLASAEQRVSRGQRSLTSVFAQTDRHGDQVSQYHRGLDDHEHCPKPVALSGNAGGNRGTRCTVCA